MGGFDSKWKANASALYPQLRKIQFLVENRVCLIGLNRIVDRP